MYTAIAATAVGVLSISSGAFFILYRFFPHYLIKISFIIRRYHAGMTVKYLSDENFVFCYGERNTHRPDKTTVVFIHGFSSSKDQWITNFKGLPNDLHLIALDLPGHGGSSVPAMDVNLSMEYMVGAVVKFLDLVGLADQKIHIVGSSLGGAIVALFTVQHQERVEKLTMVCPAMQTPVDSDFTIQLKEAMAVGAENFNIANCVLLPTDITGLKAMLDTCCYSKEVIKFGDQVWKGILHLRLAKNGYYIRLFKAIITNENMDYLIEFVVPKIKVPTQVIWGQEDMLIHVSGAKLLKSKLSNCQRVDIIDRCGHTIDIDRPGALNKYLLLFIQGDVVSQNEEKKCN